jgi:hypothetical protein
VADPVVGIVGSQKGVNCEQVNTFVRRLAKKYPDACVISADSPGVGRWAASEADTLELGVMSILAQEHEPHALSLAFNERVVHLLGQVALDYITLLLQEDHPNAKAALLHRNTIIVQSATHVVAFWNRWSTGTLHAINHAHRLKRPVTIYHPED